MPGFLLHMGAQVICSHGGQATPTAPNPRVQVSGQPITTMPRQYVVAACPFNVSGGPVPCVTAQWITSALRVTASGEPVLLFDSQALTAPNAVPLVVTSTQMRVRGS